MELREYQQRCVEAVEASAGNKLVVVPTGGGKSVIIADTIKRANPARTLMLTHVKELVAQNLEKLKMHWPKAPVGVYSASLKSKDASKQIVYATIQSVYKKDLGHFDLVLIDECHLLSRNADGMYLQLLTRLWETNPAIRFIGYSATPYRLDSGLLCEGDGALFDGVVAEVTIKELVEAGFLSRLISKVSVIQANLKKVRITAGEYNAHDMEEAFSGEFLDAALPDMITLSAGRNHGIIFCPTVKFADAVAERLRGMGQSAMSISAQTDRETRDLGLAAFKAGMYRWLCSVNLVTTGFDAPIVDCIVLWRATMSPGLYYQMVGRGLRIAPDKTDCLVLDYGGNIVTHGPITKIKPPAKKNKRTERPYISQVKICEVCRSANELDALECMTCGNELVVVRDVTKNLSTKASDIDIMDFSEPVSDWVEVDSVSCHVHKKLGKPDSMRVEYRCGLMVYKEWVHFDNPKMQWKAHKWWCMSGWSVLPPQSTNQAVLLSKMRKTPSCIRIKQNGKYTEVIDYDFRSLQEKRPDRIIADSFTNSELAPIVERLQELRQLDGR